MKWHLLGLVVLLGTVAVWAEEEAESEGDKKESSYGTVIGIDLGTTYSW